MKSSLTFKEIFGLDPLDQRLREALVALRGDPETPKARFDYTSLKMMRPGLSMRLWAGQKSRGAHVAIYNLFNHRQPPPALGWSVRVTDVLDFRGRKLTYDSHNGTDFAVAPGTRVCASAAGTIMRISREFNRGGLKIFIDHGRGLCTTYNHLGRAFVTVGQRVSRGELIALAGYSGLDGLLTFPWGAPHVHFNVWLNGQYVDPFASECALVSQPQSIWRQNNRPLPTQPGKSHCVDAFDDAPTTQWNEESIARGIADCLHEPTKHELEQSPTHYEKGAALLFFQQYFPTRFARIHDLYTQHFEREQRLDLPFFAEDFSGVYFPDEG
jgi:murein DD-endopeptidase